MVHIKRLYTFILQSFLPLFLMTFGICLFIVLMQFLWRYVEELVGKGLDNSVLAELFLYAALNLIPMALPLAILLASLMTFGNMGERLELLAIKASGVSLLKAMRPLIIVIAGISIGAFFFQNDAMPKISVKFFALLNSIKQKTPELNIPEGSFYSDIDNFSIYVKKKDTETRMLHGVMIYDMSKGFNNMSVIVCDSAKMTGSESKEFLLLNMYNGQQFGNLREAEFGNATPSYSNSQFIPYSRENFKTKDFIIKFNSGFDRMDESAYEGTQIALNIGQLSHAVDSMRNNLDSMNVIDKQSMLKAYETNGYNRPFRINDNSTDTTKLNPPVKRETLPPVNFDSLINSLNRNNLLNTIERATSKSEGARNTFSMQSWTKTNLQTRVRRHQVELHRKFTLSFACIIFFFIGAPLGAIIRKGGMGVPVIISVIFFIIYYVMNNIGEKMARDGICEMWQGMWFSSFILFPIGVFLTYKSMNDSDLFNVEAYAKYLRKLLRIKTSVNQDALETYNNSNIPDISEIEADKELIENLNLMQSDKLRDILYNFHDYGYDRSILVIVLSILKSRGETPDDITVTRINTEQVGSITKAINSNSIFALTSYVIALGCFVMDWITDEATFKWAAIAVGLAYIAFYIRSILEFNDLYKAIQEKITPKQNGIRIIGMICYPILYIYQRINIKNITKRLGKH